MRSGARGLSIMWQTCDSKQGSGAGSRSTVLQIGFISPHPTAPAPHMHKLLPRAPAPTLSSSTKLCPAAFHQPPPLQGVTPGPPLPPPDSRPSAPPQQSLLPAPDDSEPTPPEGVLTPAASCVCRVARGGVCDGQGDERGGQLAGKASPCRGGTSCWWTSHGTSCWWTSQSQILSNLHHRPYRGVPATSATA